MAEAALPANPLVEAGLLTPIGSDGLYARSRAYEEVTDALQRLLGGMPQVRGSEALGLPSLITAKELEAHGYFGNFPQLAARVYTCHCEGTERAFQPSQLALLPAACYPLYPLLAARGVLTQARVFDVRASCFRNEPSREPWRLQAFRMREFVFAGAAAGALEFRAAMMEAAAGLAAALGLRAEMEEAFDPFFGRANNILKAAQLESGAKFELVAAVEEGRFAFASFNSHGEMFGAKWGIRLADGTPASTCCNAFGIDRMAVALFLTHGVDARRWPDSVRDILQLHAG